MKRVLIVDDDPVQLQLAAEAVREAGYAPLTAGGGRDALKLLRADRRIGAVLLDLVMPDLDGMAVLEILAREAIATPVIVQSSAAGKEIATSVLRAGAVDVLAKPVAAERLIAALGNAERLAALENALRSIRSRQSGTLGSADFASVSPSMQKPLSLIPKMAKGGLPVLIEGEHGTGKRHFARILHDNGDRRGRPFVAFDCRSVGNLIPALLAAQGGTLYLNEIGDLPPAIQTHLLAVLESGAIAHPGATRPERLTARIIAATSHRLLNLARSGDFREDLYYRLTVLPTYLPPLRDRLEDIEPLSARFIAVAAVETGRRVAGLSGEALELLNGYDWPANIGELERVLYRAVTLAEGAMLEPADFPAILARLKGRVEAAALLQGQHQPSAPVHIDTLRPSSYETGTREAIPDRFLDATGALTSLAGLERELIVFALERHERRMSQVARALGIGRSTLYRKFREYGLDEAIRDAA